MKHESQTKTSHVGDLAQLRRQIDELTESNARLKLENENLQESQVKYEAVVQAFEGFIYICSSRYEVEFMNERLIERTGGNAVGEKCHRVLHDLDHVCPWCVNERVFRGETVRWGGAQPQRQPLVLHCEHATPP